MAYIKKTIGNQTFEVGTKGELFHHPRNQQEEREAFEKYLFKHLQPFWNSLPRELATLHKAYVREYLELYSVKLKRKRYTYK